MAAPVVVSQLNKIETLSVTKLEQSLAEMSVNIDEATVVTKIVSALPDVLSRLKKEDSEVMQVKQAEASSSSSSSEN
jgi:hypothetical protein